MASKDNLKPNIITIVSDDQGYWALGAAGNSEIITPNLDRLARTGIRFENFFCTSPVCSPARASLLTGRIPSQHGVHDWIREGNSRDNAVDYLAGQTGYSDLLAANGYTCGISGKWHLGNSFKPQNGFSHWFVHEKGGGPYYNAPMVRNGELITQPGYITDAITDDAVNFLDEQAGRDEPFYLSVHYTAPHTPWIGQHPPEIVGLYKDCPFESIPRGPFHPWSLSIADFDEARKNPIEHLQGYFAAVTAMDFNIGRLVDRLEALNLRENTLVCFLSDNGMNTGHHGIWGKGNGTFPLNMFDTSVRVPAIFSHPGRIPAGTVLTELVSGYDFMPTLLEYVGLTNPESAALPGKSFSRLLSGSGDTEREHIVVFDEYGPVRMIRTGEWKYIHRYPYGPNELYDLKNDPEENSNLIEDTSQAGTVKQLKMELEEWFFRYVNPALDGTHEAVTGSGQVGLAGIPGRGNPAY